MLPIYQKESARLFVWPIWVVSWSTRSMQQGLLKSLTWHLHHYPSSWETEGQPSTPRCPLGILVPASIMWSDHLSWYQPRSWDQSTSHTILLFCGEEMTKLQTAQHQVICKETGKNPVTQSIYQSRPWSPQICFCLNYSNTCRLILNYPDYWGRVASPCFRRVLVDKFNEMDDLVLSPTVLWHCFLQRSTQPFHSPFISINRLVFTEGPRSGSREV